MFSLRKQSLAHVTFLLFARRKKSTDISRHPWFRNRKRLLAFCHVGKWRLCNALVAFWINGIAERDIIYNLNIHAMNIPIIVNIYKTYIPSKSIVLKSSRTKTGAKERIMWRSRAELKQKPTNVTTRKERNKRVGYILREKRHRA